MGIEDNNSVDSAPVDMAAHANDDTEALTTMVADQDDNTQATQRAAQQESLRSDIRKLRRMNTYIALMMFGAVIYFAKDIIMPIVLGLLITLTLTPVVRLLTKINIPHKIAAVLVVVGTSAALVLGVYTLSEPFGDLFASLPDIGERLEQRMVPYQSTLDELSQASDQVKGIVDVGGNEEQIQQVVVERPGLLTTAASTLASGLSSLLIALLLSLFILSSGTLFYEKIVAVMPALSGKKRALRIVYDVEKSVSRYLLTITLINIGLGIVIASLLALVGTPNAFLWGTIATILNFLPFLGAVVGTGLLAIVSLGGTETIGMALLPPALYLTCTTLEANFVTPLIVGKRLSLNIVAVFLTVAVWGWLWGLAGALMAVPILVVINVLCDHVESWSPFGQFLSGRRPNTDL